MSDANPPSSSKSLLVVDDDPDIREITTFVLEAAGYRVVCAADGQEAIKILAGQPFDLVITDMLMPGGDGLELLAAVKKSRSNCRVLVMSGGGMIGVGDYLTVAKKLGAHGVLEKPFSGEVLLATVADLLKKAD
ncbi:MAG: response regulator [Opitutaceae bacterium]